MAVEAWKTWKHEPEVCEAMQKFIQPGMRCVDCGANEGYFTAYMAHLTGPTGLVIAFEPDYVVYERLVQNCEGLDNVTVRREVLWSVNAPAEFWRASESGYSAMFQYADISVESYMMAARSLDTLLLAPQPDFIKVDCEGADENVLRGAEQILRKGVECVTAEINFHINYKLHSTEQSFREFMNGLGYDFFVIEHGRQPLLMEPQFRLRAGAVGHVNCINVMFAKRAKVEQLWNYDCMDYVRSRFEIDRRERCNEHQ